MADIAREHMDIGIHKMTEARGRLVAELAGIIAALDDVCKLVGVPADPRAGDFAGIGYDNERVGLNLLSYFAA